MGRLHTPQTPRFDFRGTVDLACPGGGPYTALKHACAPSQSGTYDAISNRGIHFDAKNAHLMKGMTALGHYMGLFSRKSEAEAERFEAYGALFLVIGRVLVGYNR